jgi:hypothetical protein
VQQKQKGGNPTVREGAASRADTTGAPGQALMIAFCLRPLAPFSLSLFFCNKEEVFFRKIDNKDEKQL